MLLEGDGVIGEGDVVIGGKQSDQGDHGAAGGFQQALAIETQRLAGGNAGLAEEGLWMVLILARLEWKRPRGDRRAWRNRQL